MRIKRVILTLPVAVCLFFLLISGVLLVSVVRTGNEEPRYTAGQGVSPDVTRYTQEFENRVDDYGLQGYEKYLYAIMMVETGGIGNDPMQSLTNSGLEEKDKTPSLSIKVACAYFSTLLNKAEILNCDIWTVIQAYNYGAGYIDYVADRGGKHTFVLASEFAAQKSGWKKVDYNNPIAVAKNGGWRYDYGNMFYVYLVKQYLSSDPMSEETANVILQEAFKYEGWKYVWGGNTPETSFDCSGLVQWCYGYAGIALPRTAQEQYDVVQHLDMSEAQPGDLVFFTKTYQTDNYITHVGIYVGDGKMFHAGNPIGYANLSSAFYKEHFVCIGRVKQVVQDVE